MEQQNRRERSCTNPLTSLLCGCSPWLQGSADLQSAHHGETQRVLQAGTPISLLMFNCGNSLLWKRKGWFTKHWWVCRSNQHKKRWKPLSDIVVGCHTPNCCEQGLAEAQGERLVFQASCRRAGTFYLKGFTANLPSNAGDTDLVWASRNGLMRFLSLLNKENVSTYYKQAIPVCMVGFSFQYDFLPSGDAEDIFLWWFLPDLCQCIHCFAQNIPSQNFKYTDPFFLCRIYREKAHSGWNLKAIYVLLNKNNSVSKYSANLVIIRDIKKQ